MVVNVREVDREQLWLMPPSLSDWLPEDHLAWFILDVVAELDLGGFYANLRDDGRGGAAYDPAMMLAVLLYAYCVGERSSRRVERRLVEDVAFRVVAANQCPDHATLARFRAQHQEAITALFAQVLGLCVTEGLVATGVVSVDSTKLEANASAWSNRTRRQIAEEIVAEAERADAAEDAELGDRRGGELPERWARQRDRRPRLAEALRQLEGQGASDWEAYQAERAAKEATTGRRLAGRKPRPGSRNAKERHANTTDPDSRMLRARNRFLQGYNAQAAISEDQVVVAAELTNAANDSTMFAPLARATEANLAQAGWTGAVGAYAADAGYWSVPNATLATGAAVLIAPMPATQGITDPDDPRIAKRDAVLGRLEAGRLTLKRAAAEMGVSETWARHLRDTRRRGGPDPARARKEMLSRLASEEGRSLYAKRWSTAEPVFGNIKANLRFRRFSRRGKRAVLSEWRLICSVHNLLKVRAARLAAA
ncbi:MAG TPA: IS1182 family transposase [Acidimicrobiales bacterium]|nr:IS1182 family transposase [Acidimicrobiales bacterium]